MSKINWSGGALLAPVPPCLVTCGNGEHNNIFTVAWTGILNTKPPRTYIAIRPQRYSYELIRTSNEFVINLPTRSLVKAADTCGVISGRDRDKFQLLNLHTAPASVLCHAPLLHESPLSLECRVEQIIPMETHHIFLADILSVDVEETLIDVHGKLHLEKADLIAYAHGAYFALGDKLGKFGFSVQKKKKRKPKTDARTRRNA